MRCSKLAVEHAGHGYLMQTKTAATTSALLVVAKLKADIFEMLHYLKTCLNDQSCKFGFVLKYLSFRGSQCLIVPPFWLDTFLR